MVNQKAHPPKGLVWTTLFFLVILILTGLIVFRHDLPEGIPLNTKGQPTIGYPKARVHVVVFEEPKCDNCKDFNDKIFPKLKEDFIDTNKIIYTVIPVSFLPNSMPAAVALLCVYYTNPLYPNNDLFFTYLNYIYEHQPPEHTNWATLDTLVAFARNASPAINRAHLKTCMEKEIYRIKIEKNNAYGRKIMDGMLTTPTVYVNGIKAQNLNYKELKKLIIDVLERKGVQQ
ncbi:MAG: thioredoxin domain-containing protein [Chlamydiia bacterium]|nr:thioredoxin domain-containing protein [Chlamydiia bacterium]